MAKKTEMKMVCSECGKDAPIDQEKSNSNWTVYKSSCDSCGSKTKLKL